MKAETSNTEPTDADRPNKSNTARGTENVSDGKGSSRQLGLREGGRGEGKAEMAPTEDDQEAWEAENQRNGKSKL